MKAVLISQFLQSLEDIHVVDLPFPEVHETTLLIRVTHVSTTHVDMLYAQGKHQNNQRHAKPPFILGMDFAGTVEQAPQDSPLRRGDDVYGSHFGAFAEYIAIDASEGVAGVRKVPKQWSNAEACAVGASGAISLGCFLRAGSIRKDDWVLVTGASGGLGVIAVQIAKALGAKVIALVGSDEKARILKDLGVDACVSYDEEKWESRVLDISGGGVSVVYDAVGMVEKGLRCCKFGGTVVIVGFAGREGQMESMKLNRILLKGAGVVGYVSRLVQQHDRFADDAQRFGEHGHRAPNEASRIWAEFDRMIEAHAIKSVIYKQYDGLQAIGSALQDLQAHKVWGRAVIKVSDVLPSPQASL